jgi:Uma2 family endonuclease
MATTPEIILNPEKEYELVNGQPEEKEMGGARHGGVGMRLGAEIWVHVKKHKLGGVYGSDTSFQIGQNERLPDVSFVAAERIPLEGEPEGIWPIAPDLAVEIISPNDLYEKVNSKVLEYLAAGVQQVWLVSPEHKTVTIFRSPTEVTVFSEDSELASEDLLPGFRCRLSDLFKTPTRT